MTTNSSLERAALAYDIDCTDKSSKVKSFLVVISFLQVVMTGADLFTGNCMYMPAAWLQGKISLKRLARVWTVSYLSNFVGAVIMAYFFTYLCKVLRDEPWHTYALKLAWTKTAGQGWGVVFLKGIAANWLVCLALFLAIAADSVEGKILGIW